MAKHATTKRHQKTKAPFFAIIFFILAIIATIIVLKIFKVVDFGKNVNHSTETAEKIHQKTDQPNESSGLPIHTEDGTKEDAAAGRTPKTPEQYEGQDVNQLDKLTGTVTYSEKSGNKYRIRVNINQFLKLPGTCKITVYSSSNVVYSETVNVVPNPSSGSCEGFDIPLASLPSGNLNFKIDVNANQKTGLIEGLITN